MLLDGARASLLMIDVQERLLPAMADPARVVARGSILLAAARQLDVPVTVSEQYPKGLGHTVAALDVGNAQRFEKMTFSCWRDDAMKAHFVRLHESGRPLVVVAGIEAHVCVLQTALDLAQAGFGVFAVADAMSSRQVASETLAHARMAAAGIEVVNTEMAVFELLGRAGTPAFKALSALIK